MGLDMYLYGKKKGEKMDEFDWDANKDRGLSYAKYKDWKENKANFSEFYWRKANAVHAWFVKRVQGGVDECQMSEPFGKEALEELLHICWQIRELNQKGKDWKSFAHRHLPSTSGFFFGNTDYDEWYLSYIDFTIEQLIKAIAMDRFYRADGGEAEYIYHSSW